MNFLRSATPTMAAKMRLLVAFCLLLQLFPQISSQIYEICNNTGIVVDLYEQRPNSHYCYRMFETRTDFSSANRSCVRHNGFLVRIDSEEENDYILNKYGIQEFWIGLNDQRVEGVFRWIDGNELLVSNASYTNWFGGSAAATNLQSFDCVKFTAEGWKVHENFCDSSRFPYLCRQRTCNSTDGLTCIAPVVSTPIPIAAIVVAIVVVIIIVVAVAVTIGLVLMWKYRNDAFYRYILCCVYGGSKSQMNNLKQENIRLRNELSQQKINLNSSGRFQGALTRQSSFTSNVPMSPTGVKPPISLLDQPGKPMPPARSVSMVSASNRVLPLRTPQPSVSTLLPAAMGRSYSVSSGASLPIRSPVTALSYAKSPPPLSSIKETATPNPNRPSSSESSSSESSTDKNEKSNKEESSETKD